MTDFCSFHEGKALGLLERACIASFARHGHRFKLYSYHPLDVPEGVVLADAREIIPFSEYEAFFAQAPGRISQFSNGFRYAMLHAQGGWWVDTDVLCTASDVPKGEIILGWQSPPVAGQTRFLGSALMKLPAGHAVARRTYDFWREHWSEAGWGVTGPRALTRAVEELNMNDAVRPFGELFYTLWDDSLLFFDPSTAEEAAHIAGKARLLHLANSGLGFQGLSRNLLPPRGSYLRPHIIPTLSDEDIAAGDDAFVTALVKGFRTLKSRSG